MMLGLFAQIGLLAHLFSLLVPVLGEGATGFAMGGAKLAAILGRSMIGWMMPVSTDRRLVACASYGVQVIGSLSFAALNRGDYEASLAAMAPRFEHIFAGTHPLGGKRHTVPAMRRWFERLFRLNEHLNFTIKHVAVSGWPWDTTVVVEWRDSATLFGEESYVNDGTHIARMRWAKVVALQAYLDTGLFDDACRRRASPKPRPSLSRIECHNRTVLKPWIGCFRPLLSEGIPAAASSRHEFAQGFGECRAHMDERRELGMATKPLNVALWVLPPRVLTCPALVSAVWMSAARPR